ncbi:MAG: peptide chain release factor N(5)-glutamine methyltransferase [Clostridia bacterium]|nr:peptide chain release factor N(5)-glutamine methyltransferase [Clostridia bacterium]
MTCFETVRDGELLLASQNVPDADFDAKQLFMHAAGMDQTAYALQKDCVPGETVSARFRSLLERRIAGEPLQYILGEWDFCGNRFYVGEGVLIPRPETEELTQFCIESVLSHGYRTVYDLCAGSGCIGISIAAACKQTQVYLVERYDAAIGYMQKNIPAEFKRRLHVVRRDVFTGPDPELPAPELLVSNPPYIPSAELCSLQTEVQREPATALDGGIDGLDFYRAIASRWLPVVCAGGMLAFECGETQAMKIASLFAPAKTQIKKDIYGADRFVVAEK